MVRRACSLSAGQTEMRSFNEETKDIQVGQTQRGGGVWIQSMRPEQQHQPKAAKAPAMYGTTGWKTDQMECTTEIPTILLCYTCHSAVSVAVHCVLVLAFLPDQVRKAAPHSTEESVEIPTLVEFAEMFAEGGRVKRRCTG